MGKPGTQFLGLGADEPFMRHVADAKKLLEGGKSREALAVLDNLLGLAPRNHEALRLKATILDAQGRFDESLLVLRDLSRCDSLSAEVLRDLERRTLEEREVAVYSELTPEGRWYFAFPAAQLWISLYGFLGCAFFLLMSPALLSQNAADALPSVAFVFLIFVAMPWFMLLTVHMVGIKKILVGLDGLKICTRFRQRLIPWSAVTSASLEHHTDNRAGTLFLVLYGRKPAMDDLAGVHDNTPAPKHELSTILGASTRAPETASPVPNETRVLLRLNVSPRHSVVRARRHFVRAVLTHIDVVSYVTVEPEVIAGLPASENISRDAG